MNEHEKLKAELREEVKAEILRELLINRDCPIKPITPHRKYAKTVDELFYKYKIDIIRDYPFRAAINGAIKQILNINVMTDLKEAQLPLAIEFTDEMFSLIAKYRDEYNHNSEQGCFLSD